MLLFLILVTVQLQCSEGKDIDDRRASYAWFDFIRGRGPKLKRNAYKIREILPKIGWLLLLYLVCVLCQSA